MFCPSPLRRYSKQTLFSLHRSSLVPSRLSDTSLRSVRSLGISAVPSSRRGRRGGKSVKINRATRKFLYCGLANARSLVSNKYVISHHLTVTGLDVLAVTETWLNEENGDAILREVCPSGYSAIHCPRPRGRGGGLAIFFRDSLRVGILQVDFRPDSFEYLYASLCVNGVTIRLVVVYRPPSLSPNQFLIDFADLLELLLPHPSKLLIVGDFNIHVDSESNAFGQKFLSLIESCDLHQHVDESTHHNGHTLDLVLSRTADNLVLDCYVSDVLSDHSAVHWFARASRPARPRKAVTFRNLKSLDLDVFVTDLLNLQLFTAETDDVTTLLEWYNDGLTSVLNKHAPTQKRVFTIRPDNPWNNADIHSMRKLVRRLERKWKLSGLAIDKEILLHALGDLRSLISTAKVEFLNSKIVEQTGKKSLFKIVDSFLLKKPSLRLPSHDDLLSLLENFGNFFLSKVRDIWSSLESAGSDLEPEQPLTSRIFSTFSLVTTAEVASLILRCPTKSSPLDPIPTYLLKNLVDVLVAPITKIVNLSLSSGVFPDAMKLALVTPLLKKPNMDPDILSNYRPVSNLSFLSKLIERVVIKQLNAHLESDSESLLVPVQSAYRPYHSTETALLKVVNDLLLSVDEKDTGVVMAFLDQSAAFDLVDHNILIDRLAVRFGIRGHSLAWFQSYLSSRRQSISVSGITSSPVYLLSGVPQGSVLGPVLYNLYTSPIHDISTRHGIDNHQYADDDQKYIRFRTTPTGADQHKAFSSLSACIEETKRWGALNRMKYNDTKTEVLLVFSKYGGAKPINLSLAVGEEKIKPVSSVRSLGVTIDSHLTMDGQIRSICKNAFYHLRRISQLKKFLSKPALAQLIHAFVISRLDYCNSLLAGLSKASLDRLQRVQNAAARLLHGAKKFDSIHPILLDLHWLPIAFRIDYKIAVFTYRCLNGLSPRYLQSLLRLPVSSRLARDRLITTKPRTKTYGSRSFTVYAPQLWNSLPLSVRTATSLAQFCSRLKTHLITVAFKDEIDRRARREKRL